MNRKSFLCLLLCAVGTFTWATPLEYPATQELAKFGVGTGNGLLSFGPDDGYEPHWPTAIATTTNGDLFVLDYRQGIIRYDSSFRYVSSVQKIFHRFSISDTLIVAWNSESDSQELFVYSIEKTALVFQASLVLEGQPKIKQSTIRENTVVTVLRDDSIVFWRIVAGKQALVKFSPSDSDLAKMHLSISGSNLMDSDIGLLSLSAEDFFFWKGKPEVQYAELTEGRDTININSGTIVGIDSS